MQIRTLFSPIIPVLLIGLWAAQGAPPAVDTQPDAVLTGGTFTTDGMPVEEVDIVIEGDYAATAITDFDGTFIFSNIPDGSAISNNALVSQCRAYSKRWITSLLPTSYNSGVPSCL
jgi:hypothetical protein